MTDTSNVGVPRLSSRLVERPVLMERLAEEAALTVVRGPAGFGKTTSVAQWARARHGCTLVWTRARPGGTAEQFWTGVRDALVDAGLDASTPGASAPQVVERALARSGPVVVVMDGYHHLDSADVDEAVVDLLRHVSSLRIVACVRSERQLSSHLVQDLDPVVIGPRDLAFTVADTRALADLMGIPLTDDLAAGLVRNAGGWPEAIRAALSAGARDSTDVREAVRRHFRARVLPAHQAPGLTDLAVATSVVDEFTADMAGLLWGVTSPSDIGAGVDALMREGLLLSEDRAHDAVYRWPPAGRDVLLEEARRRGGQYVRGLHQRMASWFLDRGGAREALHHARSAQDWPLVVRVIERSWRELVVGHNDELHQAFSDVPDALLDASPRALAVRDTRLEAPDDRLLRAARLTAGAAAIERLLETTDVEEVLDTALAVGIALRLRGAYRAASRYAEQALAIAEKTRSSASTSRVAALYPVLHLHAGINDLLTGDLQAGAERLGRAHARANDHPGTYVAADAAGKLALTHVVTGDLAAAEAWLPQHDTHEAPAAWLVPHMTSASTTARLMLAVDRLQLDEATAIDAALRRHVTRDELWAWITYARATFATVSNRPGEALALIEQARAGNRRWLTADAVAGPLLRLVEAEALLAAGHGNHLLNLLRSADAEPLLLPVRARFELLSGDAESALHLAHDPEWERTAWTRHRIQLQLVRALAAHRLGHAELATVSMVAAVIGARAAGDLLRPFAGLSADDLVAAGGAQSSVVQTMERVRARVSTPVYPTRVEVVELTAREQQVLHDLAAGLSVPEIASRSVLSYNTVRTQQRSLYRKLGTSDREHALAEARKLGLM